jgi:hypothetical protein
MNFALNRRQLMISGGGALLMSAGGAALLSAAEEPVERGVKFLPFYAIEKDVKLKWVYQSFLLQPTGQDLENKAGSTVNARKWAMGDLSLTDGPGECEASGTLVFGEKPEEKAELKVTVTGTPGHGLSPATFEAVGEGVDGPMAGARYLLRGFAIRGNDGKLGRVHGSVFVIAGTRDKPAFEPGGMPVGTAGTFTIVKVPT